jgi:hypothetical protein
VRGRSWTVFGIIIVTILLALVAQTLFVALFLFLPAFFQTWLGGLVANSLVVPFVVLSWTVVYFQLRGDRPPREAAA